MFGLFKSSQTAPKKADALKTTQQSLQETYIQENQAIMSAKAFTYVNDYNRERQSKLDLIAESMVANGIDMDEFLSNLAKGKGLSLTLI